MLAWPYGFAQVMSSYSFIRTDDGQGKQIIFYFQLDNLIFLIY